MNNPFKAIESRLLNIHRMLNDIYIDKFGISNNDKSHIPIDITNPFSVIDSLLNSIEALLLDIKHKPKNTTHPTTSTPEPFIKGIHELAKFLKVSPARAQKLKNEGVFPYWQDGRTLLFDPAKIREAMMNIKKKKK